MNYYTIIKKYCNVIECERCNALTDSRLLRDKDENVPQPGYIGRNYEKYRLLLIGQNPGVCPPSMIEKDTIYMKSLLDLASQRTINSYEQLYQIMLKFVPEWPVQKSYFPLKECGLGLEDIAYCNIVRCRTSENTKPSKRIAQNCIEEHLVSLINTIEPKIIVCIGKWAYDQLILLLKDKSITVTYMNRDRSLSRNERLANRKLVVATVLGKIRIVIP